MKKIMEIFKKNKIKTLIFSGLLVLAIAGVSFAIFLVTRSGSQRTITFANVSVDYAEGTNINVTNNLPMSEADAINYGARKNFSVTNNGNITEYIKLSLTSISISNSLKNSNFRYMLYETSSLNSTTLGSKITSGDFSNITNNSIELVGGIEYSANATKYYTLIFYIYDNGGDQTSMLNSTFNAKITAEASDKYVDASGANKPELVQGMVPVIYNESSDVWEVANPSSKWYAYSEQMWANAVTVNNATYRSAAVGTQIPMSAIDTMWVWIPRYKYKITSNIGSTSSVTSSPQIDVVFESGTETTGTALSSCGITATNCYYTHPAFRNGASVYKSSTYDLGGWSSELSGIWVGKFETGGTADKPLIKPDIVSLTNQNISTEFQTSLKFAGGTMDTSTGEVSYSSNNYGITRNTTTDSHMAKNTEWGAVAYLSQSKYGKNGNSNYSGANKEIYINNSSSMYTGRSYGATNTSNVSTTNGTYGYNDKSCSSTSANVCTGSKTANKGTGASTTGTIYGIYDMSGGAYEYTMSNWAGYSGNSSSNNSGFNGPYGNSGSKTDGIAFPSNQRYYDKYTGTLSSTATSDKSIKGDATWETQKWYSDSASFIYVSNPWAIRGGYCSNTSFAGAFSFNYYNGNAYSISGFRSVLIP